MAEIARLLGLNHKMEVKRLLQRAGISSRDSKTATKLAMLDPEIRAKCGTGPRTGNRKPRTEAQKEQQRKVMLGRVPPNKGDKWSEETRAKHAYRQTPEYREARAAERRGELNPRWKGGTTEEDRRLTSWQWRLRRREVYERDKWLCQDCGCKCLGSKDSKAHPKRKIQAHHVVSRRNGGSDDLENLVTLCMSCHQRRERLSTT